ncbi:MAG TPA: XamI family restriction endonuclease [Acidobacteriaceae bacterium]|jgi:hypothetical protein
MRTPERWTDEELNEGLTKAKDIFREERMEEALEPYLSAFDSYRGDVEDLLEASVDLSQLDETVIDLLTTPALQDVFRYLSGPFISKDDLKVLAEASLAPSVIRNNPAMAKRILEVVKVGLDRRRFPWVNEGRPPSESEKNAAIVSSAALMANSRVSTNRKNESKDRQEEMVRDALLARGYKQVPAGVIKTLSLAPQPGEFCRESLFGTSKADFLVGLWDTRVMAIECKVSNSATNSVKRLNHEAAGKAEKWIHEFGALGVVPVAVLSGDYKLNNLKTAQARGLTIYWAHDLTQMFNWVEIDRPRS